MQKQLLLFLFLFSGFGAFAQPFTISGYIEDAASGEKLIGANVLDRLSGAGAVTNDYGFYSLTLPADTIQLSFSYIGYQAQEQAFLLKGNTALNVKLQAALELETVEVVESKVENTAERSQMSLISLPVEQIKRVPALLGEVDVLKALQLLPGVQSGGEGQSGLYVRGGSPDQNLILLDGVPVYNASHLFGFFSVFNADAINSVKLLKGGFPARYGGRLSSVIEINMKEGHQREIKGSGSIGVVAAKFTLEGPIVKEKTSFIVSARRTYIDILARPLIRNSLKEDGIDGTTGYYFYDVNAKVNHKFSDKDRLYLSFYGGRDKFYLDQKEGYPNGGFSLTESGFSWGNVTTALRWNHLWNNKLFSNTTLTYSSYNFDTKAVDEFEEYASDGSLEEQESFRLRYDSGIRDYAAKLDFDYYPNPNHYIRFGGSVIWHRFDPGRFSTDAEVKSENFRIDTTFGQKIIHAQELALYVEDDMRLGDALKMNVGLHASAFAVEGAFYTSLQPRLSLRYLFDESLALKTSFASMRQYVQLLTNENLSLPTDLWLPTTDQVRPQDSWQVALGLSKSFSGWELSLEGYYKEMDEVLAYQEGASLFEVSDWQTRVTQGKGQSYGAELFLHRKAGRLNGWIGYTLSWTWRQFDDVNLGERYPYKYDRRHDLSIVATFDLNERVRFSGAWVFGTGNAVTLPESKYEGVFLNTSSSGIYVFFPQYFTGRNNYRMENYHRLDLGIDFIKKRDKWKRTWSIGAYNTYNRRNPFFLYLDDENVGGQDRKVLKQASLFPVIPYVTYGFEF